MYVRFPSFQRTGNLDTYDDHNPYMCFGCEKTINDAQSPRSWELMYTSSSPRRGHIHTLNSGDLAIV